VPVKPPLSESTDLRDYFTELFAVYDLDSTLCNSTMQITAPETSVFSEIAHEAICQKHEVFRLVCTEHVFGRVKAEPLVCQGQSRIYGVSIQAKIAIKNTVRTICEHDYN